MVSTRSRAVPVIHPLEMDAARRAIQSLEDDASLNLPLDEIFVQQDQRGYRRRDHQAWDSLTQFQIPHLAAHASAAWRDGAAALELSKSRVPSVEEVSRRLFALTGWQIRATTGHLPSRIFFRCLSQKIMPVTVTLHSGDRRESGVEPDAFHDLFGHAPLCADPRMADILERFGKVGVQLDPPQLERLEKIFWFTVEFGLIREEGEVRLLGSGLVASPVESRRCLESPLETHRPFDIREVFAAPMSLAHSPEHLFVMEDLGQIESILDQVEESLEAQRQTAKKSCTGQCAKCKAKAGVLHD
ncbi:MAG: hypothetical protein K8R92_12070 [Planctomycetes bacterium]|nr:hypothetical protein [Planctomycetota bacterium]